MSTPSPVYGPIVVATSKSLMFARENCQRIYTKTDLKVGFYIQSELNCFFWGGGVVKNVFLFFQLKDNKNVLDFTRVPTKKRKFSKNC